MKNFVVLTLAVICLAASCHGIQLKLTSNPLETIDEAKKELKKQAIIEDVKAITKVKTDVASALKSAKVEILKKIVDKEQQKLAALKAAKETFTKNYLAIKKTKLDAALSAIAAKTKKLLKFKKEVASYLLSTAMDKIKDGYAKKKAFFEQLKTPVTEPKTAWLLPLKSDFANYHTYGSKESPVDSKIYLRDTRL